MKWRLVPRRPHFHPSTFILSIEDCFEGAAGLIDGDLDEEDFHLAELRVAHFVNALWQTERPGSDKGECEWLADGFRSRPERACLGKFHGERAVGEDDFEILIQASGELFAANGGEIEHAAMLTARRSDGEDLTADNADEREFPILF
jgi:hypothetical protein